MLVPQKPVSPLLLQTIRALNCETRIQLIDLLSANPKGFTAATLGRLLGVNGSTITHHLRLLVRQGLLVCVEHRYILNSERLIYLISALVGRWHQGVGDESQSDAASSNEMIREVACQPTRLRILRLLALPREVGLNVRDVARLTGLSHGGATFHLKVLEDAGIVRSVKTWDARRSYITDAARAVLRDELASQSDK